jgi:hypothetical protein
VLAVVEDQEQAPIAQGRQEGRQQRLARLLTNPDGRGDRRGDEVRIGQRRQLDQPDAVGIRAPDAFGNFER